MNKLRLLRKDHFKTLFPRFFGYNPSDAFIECADNSLGNFFEEQYEIVLPIPGIDVFFGTDPNKLNYKKGEMSSFNVELGLINGVLPATICWRSKSGRVYEFADEDIDCNDIDFWLEGVEPAKVKAVYKPVYSLFRYPYDLYIEQCKKQLNIVVSENFLSCASFHLSAIFEKLTGIKFSKRVSIGWTWDVSNAYTKGETSKYLVMLWVAHKQNDISICWRSKSGRIYDMSDTDIHCDDLEFWFEGLDAATYHKQLYPKEKLPFKLKNLTYELTVERLDINLDVEMHFRKPYEQIDIDKMIQELDNWIDAFNLKNNNEGKKYEKYGVVHNWNHTQEADKIVYSFDWGSASYVYLNELLQHLSELNMFEKVVLC